MVAKIKVTGLRELNRDLKKLSDQAKWASPLRLVNLAAATVVSDEAKRTAGQSRSNMAGGLARLGSAGVGSIRPLASATRATVAGGGGSVPYFGGNEFGSHGGARTRQFPAAKSDGYNIYPAIDKKRDQILKEYADMLAGVVKPYFG